jgi:magnesium transporter
MPAPAVPTADILKSEDVLEESGFLQPTLEDIRGLLETQNRNGLRELLLQVHPADIADILDNLAAEEAVITFELLPVEIASEVLDETGSPVRQELVEKVDDERLADLLDELPMDDAAEFLYDLPEEISERLIDLMEPEEATEVQELLKYEDETAGRLMTRDIVALRRQWTVQETYEFLRNLEDVETLTYLYVVDRHNVLIGVVPLRTLLLAQPERTIEEIMQPDVLRAPVTADQEELAELISRYDFFAIPIVDAADRLLGIVTVDDVLDVLAEEVTEDIQRLGGSEPLEQPYFAVSLGKIVQKRIGWLMLLFLAAIFTARVLQFFSAELEAVLALGFFIPLVTGTGGNAGSQTVATIIRALTLDEVRITNIGAAWRREAMTAVILGLAMAASGFGVAAIIAQDLQVAWVVACTLPLVVVWAVTVATVVPILADHFQIDPTVISGPMITTIVDASALIIYFSLAIALLGL